MDKKQKRGLCICIDGPLQNHDLRVWNPPIAVSWISSDGLLGRSSFHLGVHMSATMVYEGRCIIPLPENAERVVEVAWDVDLFDFSVWTIELGEDAPSTLHWVRPFQLQPNSDVEEISQNQNKSLALPRSQTKSKGAY